MLLSPIDHLLECGISSEHLAWCHSVSHCQGRRIGFAVLGARVGEALISIPSHLDIVTLENTHHVQGCHTLLFVRFD